MAFIQVPGLKGQVYVPDVTDDQKKKHKCPDCFYCQQCSDDRCRVCIGKRKDGGQATCCRASTTDE